MQHKVGDKAPEFELPDQEGQTQKLSSYRGRWLLIYFYPRDNTPGCTKEACALRDHIEGFERAGAKVVGISVDSVASHDKFVRKYGLPFTLLADESKETVKRYGVWGKKSSWGGNSTGRIASLFWLTRAGRSLKFTTKSNPRNTPQRYSRIYRHWLDDRTAGRQGG